MRQGYTLVECAAVLCLMALLAAIAWPRLGGLRDWLATDEAAREVTTALAIARHAAVMQGTRTRLTVAADTLRIDRLRAGAPDWAPWWRRPGPASAGVSLEVSNPTIVFGPTGVGWGAANTRIVLRRRSQVETITVSRVGRVKRW